jgi:hypothetical protein
MTQDEIIALAEQAGMVPFKLFGGIRFIEVWLPEIEAFAKLVGAHTLMNIDPSKFMSHQEGIEAGRFAEREACAQAAAIALLGADRELAERVVRAIRARGQA